MVNMNNVKKLANQRLGAEGKFEELKQITREFLDDKYRDIKNDMINLESLIQDFCSTNDEEIIRTICERYIDINEQIQELFENSLNEDLYKKFKDKIKEIISIYITSSGYYCGSPSHSFQIVSCLQQSMLTDYFLYAREVVTESANELQYIHNELEEGLSYVFNYISSQEEKNEEIIEVVDKIKKSNRYIASARNLERMALDNNYNFVRQSGSHRIYKHITTNKIVEIPFHTVDVPIGTSFAIQKRIIENAIA